MSEGDRLHDPWLVAGWPGMGSVAITAGYYLMAKLGMHLLAEIAPGDFFEASHVNVKDGMIQRARLPRSRMFLWRDPDRKHDLIVFLGEAQPPSHGVAFCRQLIDHARTLGVTQVYTFAAMATRMRPENDAHVFGAAVDGHTLREFRQLDVQMLEEGEIGGLNGVLLGVAAESGMRGGCLLGEIPAVFSQLPFPKASLAVLEFFTLMFGISIDLAELRDQAQQVGSKLADFLRQVEKTLSDAEGSAAEAIKPQPEELEDEVPHLDAQHQQKIERMFEEAKADRSKAYLLKRELDRLKVFHDYEDRFLDLFKKPG
jgi:proteasome assembly chaperone (PAC2) family protein